MIRDFGVAFRAVEPPFAAMSTDRNLEIGRCVKQNKDVQHGYAAKMDASKAFV
jgi:hypothetical protein